METRITCSRDCDYFELGSKLGMGRCVYPHRNTANNEVYQWSKCEFGFTIEAIDRVTTTQEREDGRQNLKLLLEREGKLRDGPVDGQAGEAD